MQTVVSVHGEKVNYPQVKALTCHLTNRRFIGEEKNGQSQASFTLQDDPLNFTVSRPSSDEEPVVLAAVTVTGILHVFEHHLNG